MNKTKNICLAILLTFLTMLVTGYSYSFAVNKNIEKDDLLFGQGDNLIGSYIKANYIFQKEKKGDYTPVSVYFGQKKLFTIFNEAGGLSPAKRAEVIAKNLNTLTSVGFNAEDIMPDSKKGLGIVKINKKVLFTIDYKLAKEYKMSPEELAFVWANDLRTSLNASKLEGDSNILERKFKQNLNKYIRHQSIFLQTGVASWYGGIFHGRRAADGSVYDKNKFTAAHKSLPFGTIVKVTNLNNGRNCVVKITDRGPFVKGRIIDLSRVAATEIGMLSKGVAKVKLEIVGKS